MGEVYAGKPVKKSQSHSSVFDDISHIGLSFADAIKSTATNIFSTFTFSSITANRVAASSALKDSLQKAFSPLSAYAFIVFVLLYTPCAAVIFAMKQEFGTWKWSGIAVTYQLVLAWLSAFLVYQGGQLLGIGG